MSDPGKISGAPSVLGTSGAQPRKLATTAAETTAENPWPVRLLSTKMKEYIARMSTVWVEGQIVELSRRAKSTFMTLRDTDVEMSLPVHVWSNVLDRLGTPPEKGAHVVVSVKADFWQKTGRLSMRANDIRPVGIGELLARIEALRRLLDSEGLFAPERKKKLPFLPSCVGLITGRDSDAMKDVLQNSERRWPAVQFEVREVAVQGADAVSQVMRALTELDADPAIDVIVIARGGGSMEDLLSFSNESLVRAVSRAATPIVSAIGHEADRPLLDEVADSRASTPTDAAKRVVPDVAEEFTGLANARAGLSRAVLGLVQREQERLDTIRSRPVLADPGSMMTAHDAEVRQLRERGQLAMTVRLNSESDRIEHFRAQVIALSPQKTLDRGYAVVQNDSGDVVRDPADVEVDDQLKIRVSAGSLRAKVTDTTERNDNE
ncbi:exodeoxyribonuclease VII large subunit [Spelaeicoccus albus]|uniref:Exodeoxyribonuclease 7 large subunit n=1 Tax=Spelaeicoccus albus TaxID=1280376 RepID=A0A7Z0II24_9MICO|nr:exodeoxyribonuclease VII large subunit [Spelaeicoccus albus]NYI68017.1 exodeoxyribonuclease VII large subunit [Spelaeicoccus albus]